MKFVGYVAVTLCCLLLQAERLQAQTPTPKFEQITTRDGLPHKDVTSFVTDHAGFLWVATTEGIARYDGTNFTTFKHNARDTGTILHNSVTTMAIDSKGVIWCGTEIGISAYDPVKGTFTNYRTELHTDDPKKLRSSPVTRLMVDREDRVWIGSWENLDVFDQRTGTFTHHVHSDSNAGSIRENRIGSLLQDRKGNIWVGTFSGLDQYDPRTNTFIHHALPTRLPDGPLITSIHEDKQGTLWLATWGNGLFRYDPTTRIYKQFMPENRTPSGASNVVSSIRHTEYPGEENKLWIGTKSSGLYLFDMGSETWQPCDQTLRSSRSYITDDIKAVYDDNLGNLFLATSSGILKYSRSKDIFRNIALTNVDANECLTDVRSTYQDPLDRTGNTLYIGTWTCGAFRYDKKTGSFEKLSQLSLSFDPLTPNNAVNEFYRDARGLLWALTRQGVYVSKGEEVWQRLPHDDNDPTKFLNTVAHSVIENPDGSLWFSCYDGLELYDPLTEKVRRISFKKFAEEQGLQVDNVSFGRSMCQYPQGTLWITGAKGAIFKYVAATEELSMLRHDPNDTSSMPFPYSLGMIIADRRGQLWTTSVNGLMTFNPMEPKPRFTIYHTSDGLPSEVVYDLSEDKDGRIWVATHNGLCSFDPETRMFRAYGEGDGVIQTGSIEYSTFGIMYIHGQQRFQFFDPSSSSRNDYCGPIRITGIKVLGKDYNSGTAPAYTDSVTLSHNENEITISFAMIHFSDAKQITYEYFLEGFNSDWIPLGKSNQVTFTNLDGGTYYLRVRGYNADGVCSNDKILLTLTVLPPFWKTAWFYALIGLGALASVFGYTRIRVHNLHKQKRVLEETVEHRTELLRQEKENVEREKLRAEQSEKFKEQFLANMSHEIRTPMNAVMGMTNILLEKKPTTEQTYYLDRIRRSSETLLVIINDILDLSKIEAGKMELEHIPFHLRETMQLVCDTLQHKAEEKGLVLSCSVDKPVPDILNGDPTRLQQILINLAGNAIKFTERGSVAITCSVLDTTSDRIQLKFAVTDTGIGMTQDQLERIFHTFVQASSDTTRKYGGTGLGLSISKQLVELQGGKIVVHSEHGKGSTFSFTIAYSTTNAELVFRKKRIVSDEMIADMRGMRVLIADDNEYNRIVARDTLELKIDDVRITEAGDGVEVLAKLREQDFDLVLMDVQMPMLDGYDATRKIRKELAAPKNKLPIIALTASVIRADLEKCLQAGMNGYIAKPFRVDELLCTMHSILHGTTMVLPPVTVAETTVPTETAHVTNLTFLREFTEGDDAQLQKYIRMYLESAPKTLDAINDALTRSDYPTIKRTVHQLKPHLRFMGMTAAGTLAEKIEQLAGSGNVPPEFPALVKQLNEACLHSFHELK